jgi:Flp pilus assembly protein TadD
LTEAVADYSELIQREPENAEAYNARGVAHRDMNDFGAVYELMGSNDRALVDYSQAVEVAPESTQPLIESGLFFQQDT